MSELIRKPFYWINFVLYAIGWIFIFSGNAAIGATGIVWFYIVLDLVVGVSLAWSIHSGSIEQSKLAFIAFLVIVTILNIGSMSLIASSIAGYIIVGLGGLLRTFVNFVFLVVFGSSGETFAGQIVSRGTSTVSSTQSQQKQSLNA